MKTPGIHPRQWVVFPGILITRSEGLAAVDVWFLVCNFAIIGGLRNEAVQQTLVCVHLISKDHNDEPRRNNSHMTNSTQIKGIIPLVAIILSSYAMTTGAGAGNGATSPVADGAALFAAKCATCHGKDGRGIPNWRSKGQPDFTDAKWQKSQTDSQIAAATKNGKGKYMPAFKAKLSDEEIAAVVARIRAFGKK